MEVRPCLKGAWVVGAVLLGLGMLQLSDNLVGVFLGLLVLSLTGGITAARGRRTGGWWLLAWSVPLLPGALAIGVFAWLAGVGADPLAVVLVVYVTAGVWPGVLSVFAVALVAELVRLRLRRRRFGGPTPAWENDAPPPSYS